MQLIITRHAPLVQVIIERGLAPEGTPVIAHVEDPSILDGKDVIGVLPLHLAVRCRTVTELPMALTPEDRVAMTKGDLCLERTRECAGEAKTYCVHKPWVLAQGGFTI